MLPGEHYETLVLFDVYFILKMFKSIDFYIKTRCTRGDARIFFLYSQNVFVCTKRNFLRIYSNIVLKILLNCMNLQNMI